MKGGPCSGKTTALNRLRDLFHKHPDYRVLIAPEAATMLFENGVYPSDLADQDFRLNFQAAIMTYSLPNPSHFIINDAFNYLF